MQTPDEDLELATMQRDNEDVDYGEGDIEDGEIKEKAVPAPAPAPTPAPTTPAADFIRLPEMPERPRRGRSRERKDESRRSSSSSSRLVSADLTITERDRLPKLRQDRVKDVCPRVADPKRGRCAGPGKCRFRYHYLPDLIVNCLPDSVSANDLKRTFEKHGTVLYASVQPTSRDKQRFNREYTGFVHFANHEEAQHAIDELDKFPLHSKEHPLKVTFTDKHKGARYQCGTGTRPERKEREQERSRDRREGDRDRERERDGDRARKLMEERKRDRRRSRDTPRSSHFPYLHSRRRERSRSPGRPAYQQFSKPDYSVPAMSGEQFEQLVQYQVQNALLNMGMMAVPTIYSSDYSR